MPFNAIVFPRMHIKHQKKGRQSKKRNQTRKFSLTHASLKSWLFLWICGCRQMSWAIIQQKWKRQTENMVKKAKIIHIEEGKIWSFYYCNIALHHNAIGLHNEVTLVPGDNEQILQAYRKTFSFAFQVFHYCDGNVWNFFASFFNLDNASLYQSSFQVLFSLTGTTLCEWDFILCSMRTFFFLSFLSTALYFFVLVSVHSKKKKAKDDCITCTHKNKSEWERDRCIAKYRMYHKVGWIHKKLLNETNMVWKIYVSFYVKISCKNLVWHVLRKAHIYSCCVQATHNKIVHVDRQMHKGLYILNLRIINQAIFFRSCFRY